MVALCAFPVLVWDSEVFDRILVSFLDLTSSEWVLLVSQTFNLLSVLSWV